MKPPAGPQTPPPSSPIPPPQKSPSPPNPPTPTGANAPRGEDFDLSTLPAGPNDKKGLPAQWNWTWGLVVAALALLCVWLFAFGKGASSQKPLPIGPIVSNSAVAPATTVTVHVAGAVARPGVYSLSTNARIADALTQAGGATPDADTTNLNLAAFVQDGAQIVVPVRAASVSIAPPASSPNTQPAIAGVPSPTTAQLPTPTGTISPAAAQKAAQIEYLRAHPIDLNLASSFELQQLPGIGPAMAQDIIDYRTANGLFRSVSDLDNVKGIGEKRMEALKDLVVVK